MEWTKESVDKLKMLETVADAKNSVVEAAIADRDAAEKELDGFLGSDELHKIKELVPIFDSGVAVGKRLAAPAPSTDVVVVEPTVLQNMRKVSDGLYETTDGFTAPGKSSTGVMQYDVTGKVDYSKTAIIECVRQTSFPLVKLSDTRPDFNIKNWRFWNSLVPGQLDPNMYYGVPNILLPLAQQNWMGHVEMFDPWKVGVNHLAAKPWPVGEGRLHYERVTIVYPSGYAKADGRIKFECDGQVMAQSDTFQMNGGPMLRGGVAFEAQGLFNVFCIQMYVADNALPAGSFMRVYAPKVTIR
jgi:hypothetical protein